MSTSGIRAGRAFVELFADDSKLVRGLRAAEKKLKAFGDSIRNLGLKVMGLGTAMLTPMLGAAKAFGSMGDNVAKMARRTGMSVEAISELGFVASQTGTDIGELEIGLRRMQRTVYDAGRGLSTANDALAGLGLRAENLENLSPEGQFKLLAEAISRIEDPTRKAALAMQIFGRSGTSMLPMFEEGAAGIEKLQEEARRLGLTMSSEDARAAEQFTDALDKLWKVVKMGVFRVGAALAPALQQLAETITDVAVKIGAWLEQNRQLIVTVMQVAAAVLAGGIALTALGTIISGIGSAFGMLASIVTGVGTVLKLLGAVIAFLVSPIGLTIAAVAALGTYIVTASGAGGKALTWLGERFTVLKDDAHSAFQGISDALAAGDIGLAVKVLWLTMKMEFTRGVNFLEKAWLNFRNFFIKIGYDAWHGLLAVAEIVWHGLEVGWIETTAFFSKLWTDFTSFFSRTWESIKAGAQKAWNWIKSLFDDSIDLETENKLVEQQKQAAISRIDDEQQRKLAQREARRQSERDKAARLHEATLGTIGRDNLQKHQQLDVEYEQKMADNQADLDKARREWRDALDEAKKKRQAKEAGGPGGLDPAEDIIAKARNAIAGMGDLLAGQAAKVGAQGTFVAANVLGLQAGNATDRMANGIDKIERNTRGLRDADELAFG